MNRHSNDITNDITKLAIEALNNRLKTSENFSEQEINSVSNFNPKLFSEDIISDEQSSKLLRELCASSYISKTFEIKKSHRAIIGPIIFYAKKTLVKIITPLIKTQLDQVEGFNRSAVLAIAKLYNTKKNYQ